MDRVSPGNRRRREDCRHVQIAVPRGRRSDTHGFVGEPDVHRGGVGSRMDRDRPDPHLAAGAVDSERDFAAISN